MARHDHLRAMLLGLFLLASLGTGVELLLLEHFEEWEQWLPLVLLGLGLVSGAAAGVWPGRRSLAALRAVMVTYAVSGGVGLYLHYAGNRAFELEMEPALAGLELVWAALTGATPALAPATMVWLAALGLLFSFRHPALESTASEPDPSRRPDPNHRTDGGTT